MTVRELIEKLNKFPQDMQVVVVDADTGWIIDKPHVTSATECSICGFYGNVNADLVTIWGDYPEMDGSHML